MAERRLILPVLAVAAVLAPAAGASAATLTTGQACYHPDDMIHATVTGFPADQLVSFTGDGRPLRGGYMDEGRLGDGSTDVQVPILQDRSQTSLKLEAQVIVPHPDSENTFVTATTTVRLIESFAVRLSPRLAGPTAKVKLTATGAVSLAPLYLHVTGRDLRTSLVVSRRTIRLGTPTGPCGTLKTSFRPVGTLHPRRGTVYLRDIDERKDGDNDPESRRSRANLPNITVRAKTRATPKRTGSTPSQPVSLA